MNRSVGNTERLLDSTVAVTASFGDRGDKKLEDWPISTVGENTIHSKFNAAANAGLIAVIVSRGQVPPEKEVHTTNAKREEDRKSVHIQAVDTLAEAYDSLLITSQAVAAYKKKLCEEWKDQWAPMETPDEYVNAKSTNPD